MAARSIGSTSQTGEDRVIPFSAKVSQPVGSRLNFPIRVDDGPVQARLIQEPEPSPDGKHLAFSALTQLYMVDLPDGKPRQLSAEAMRASFTRAGRPTASGWPM